MDVQTALLQVKDLCFGYPERPLWQHCSAHIGPGATLVLGDDGSGKSTLLHLLAGALPADAGTLTLAGIALQDDAAAYRQQVFWQDPHSPALDSCGVQQWWDSLPAQYPQWSASALAAHVQGFALQPHVDKTLHQLSAGTRRKVLMAAALASGAPLTLIDEPVAGLDRASVQYLLQQALAQAAGQPGRAIVVAHYEVLEGVPWTQVLALRDGHIAGA